MEPSDRQLLDRYLAGNDEAAFRLLVDRYLPLVHGVARRVTRNDDLARDISQTVFLRLAARAALIPASLSLTAWLHRTTHSFAATLVRTEERRKKREHLVAAAQMNANDDLPHTPGWDALAPVVDQLVDALPGADRELVLARYYRGEPHATIAGRLGLSETVTRKRTSRALDKLRAMLGKQGIATTSSALATLLPAHASLSPVPSALAGSILQAASGVTPLVPGGLQSIYLLMNATQKTLIAASAVLFLTSLGYALRPVESPTTALVTAGSIHSSDPGSRATTRPMRAERTLPATVEGRRQRLGQILTNWNAVTRRREMLAFVALLQPDQFAELGEVLDANPNYAASTLSRIDTSADRKIFLLAWAKNDPDSARARLATRPATISHSELATALGTTHPEEALKWAADPDLRSAYLSGVGTVNLPAAVNYIRDLPEQRGAMLHYLWCGMNDEPKALERIVALLEPGPDKDHVVSKVADMEVAKRPASVIAMLLANPDAMPRASVDEIFRDYASRDASRAVEAISALPEGQVRNTAVSGTVLALAGRDPAQAFALLDRYPEAANDSLVSELALSSAGRRRYEDSLSAVERISDPARREQEQLKQLRFWRKAQPQEAQTWIDRHADTLSPTVSEGLRAPEVTNPVFLRPLETP